MQADEVSIARKHVKDGNLMLLNEFGAVYADNFNVNCGSQVDFATFSWGSLLDGILVMVCLVWMIVESP